MIKKTLLLIPVLSLSIYCQDLMDGVAAIVGNNVILRSDVEQLSRMNASQLRIDPDRDIDLYMKIVRNSLELLIDENILLEQAKIDTIEVKDRDVDAMLDQQIESIVQQSGSKERAEEILGSSISQVRRDYRPVIKNRLIVEKLKSEKFINVSVTRRETDEFYQTYKDSIPEIPPTFDISQILIKVSPGIKEENYAKTRADSILKCLRDGEDFEELAFTCSDDQGSASSGGMLGFIQRGDFIKSFEEVAFSLEKGEISDVINTEFGYHIIQQIDRKGEKIKVRHILIKPKVSETNIQDAFDLTKKVREMITKGEVSFESAAVEYSNDIDAKINRGNIGRIPKNQIQNPSFISVLDTLTVGNTSEIFKTDMGYQILRLNGIYDDTWTILEQWALEYKKVELYKLWISQLRSQFYIDIK